MNTTFVRSLIAGSISAVAALTLIAGGSVAQASGGECAPIYTVNGDGTASIAYPDFCDDSTVTPHFPINLIPKPASLDLMPTLCAPLDLDNLEVRAAQTSPDNWQWRYEINGDTSYLCNDSLAAEVWYPEVGMAIVQTFYVQDIIDANDAGGDYIAEFDLPCTYDTSTSFGTDAILLDAYLDQVKASPDCAVLGEPVMAEETTPDTTPDTTPGTTPVSDTPVLVNTAEVQDEPVFVDTATVPTEIPDVPNIPETPRTPNEPELPHTGSDSTPLVIGAGMVVLGLGLGFTSVSMTRKRRPA